MYCFTCSAPCLKRMLMDFLLQKGSAVSVSTRAQIRIVLTPANSQPYTRCGFSPHRSQSSPKSCADTSVCQLSGPHLQISAEFGSRYSKLLSPIVLKGRDIRGLLRQQA